MGTHGGGRGQSFLRPFTAPSVLATAALRFYRDAAFAENLERPTARPGTPAIECPLVRPAIQVAIPYTIPPTSLPLGHPMDTRLYSLESVAAILDTMDANVLAWVLSGDFPPPLVLPDGERRWTSQAVERWIDERPTERPDAEQHAA